MIARASAFQTACSTAARRTALTMARLTVDSVVEAAEVTISMVWT